MLLLNARLPSHLSGHRVPVALTCVDNRIPKSQPEILFSRNTSNCLRSSIQENSLKHTDFLMESVISRLQEWGKSNKVGKQTQGGAFLHWSLSHTNMKGLHLVLSHWATIWSFLWSVSWNISSEKGRGWGMHALVLFYLQLMKHLPIGSQLPTYFAVSSSGLFTNYVIIHCWATKQWQHISKFWIHTEYIFWPHGNQAKNQ